MQSSRQTWRVRGVPLDFDQARLADVLHDHPALQIATTSTGNGAEGENSGNGVSVHTLVSDIRFDQVATIRFHHLPPQLDALNRNSHLAIDIPVSSESTSSSAKRNLGSSQNIRLAIDQHFDGITVLYSPAEEHSVDILAVSGLGSHPYGSFTHKGDGHMWLSDSLPRDMPRARTMTYGYESGLQQSTSFSGLDDFASPLQVAICQLLRSKEKPLILIGHSLGGLLIKEALIRISESDTDSDLINHVSGALFFGVPNEGMDIESLIPMVHGQPNKPLVESLDHMTSDILKMQRRDFARVLRNTQLEIFCFYETRLSPTAEKESSGNYKMIGPLQRLVRRDSATSCLASGVSADHMIAVDRTHSELVKFASHDAVYGTVSYVLGQMHRRSLGPQMPAPSHARSHTTDKSDICHWVVPFGRNKDFVGRKSVLDQLLDLVPPTKDRDDCQRTAIEGLGGVGKTQIALEVAFRTRDEHPDCSVFWVPAVDAATFENAYREIGRQLKIDRINEDKEDVKLLVKTALDQSANNWLLIIDNADDVELLFGTNGTTPLCDYLPFSQKGSILFTTRNHETVRKLDISRANIIRLGEMSRIEAVELLYGSLPQDQRSDSESTTKLLDFLADLPLAIKQASAYMDQTSMSITQYLKLCQSSDANLIGLLSKDFGDRTRYSSIKNPVATTWLISFRHISRDNPLAAQYLQLMSFLAEKEIPKSLLPPGETELEAYSAIGTLKAYAFISERSAEETYDVHRLVRLAMRNWLAEEGDLQACVTTVIQQLDEVFPSPSYENRPTWLRYLPHALVALRAKERSTDEETKASLLSDVARCHVILGQLQDAEELSSETLTLTTKVLGAEHPSTLASINNFATILNNQGKHKEAEAMHRQALTLITKLLGAEHPSTLYSSSNLAATLFSQGKHEEAEVIYRQTLTLMARVLGVEHPSTLHSTSNLAKTLRGQGKHEEAEAIHRQTLTLITKVLGAEHPSTLYVTSNFARTLRVQGKHEEAEAVYRQTLTLRTKVLGAEHPSTLRSMKRLASILRVQGKHEQAGAIHHQMLILTGAKPSSR